MPHDRRKVLVLGGGVAGIAAATALADHGLHVELVEKRPLLGGRASSFVDKATGERVDECQHGTMRCCTNLADLLERLGVHDRICYFDAIAFLDREGRRSAIYGSRLPAPLHTLPSFLRFRSLRLTDKIAIGRAMLAILRAKPHPEQDRIDVATWLQRMRQTERALRRFWRPILVSACNEELERISCAHAFKIFREGFLLHPQAFHFGIPSVPLATLYTEPTVAYLQARDGHVRTQTTIEQLEVEGDRVVGVLLTGGTRLQADYYVSALPFDVLLRVLPEHTTVGEPYWENLRRLEFAPLCGVHLWFDRPIGCPPALAVLDRDTEWIFNKTQNFGLPAERGGYLSVVISASRRFAGMPKEALLAHILTEVRACLPEACRAELVRWQIVRWPRATFSPRPGVEAARPDQQSPIRNLLVAGEWTRTGWPSTMESAARSGYRAAEYVLAQEGRPARLVAPDLPASGLARWFA
ncbi:MAG: hydroxysqualene dehydroxylase HpnE [Chloroherpetonaceae bacterium]|nr:hydroxysqualene dehydroxylase HpnE [Chloroherpetonaceae bacterium]